MARRTFISIPVFALLALAGTALAAETPVTVSPGNPSKLILVEGRCPTFSWGEVEGAKGYELVVYRLGEEGEEAKPALRQRFQGSVTSWTPGLDACLARGGRYAWSVRAAGGKRASEWSSPSLFAVASGPSEAELHAALAAVREVLGQAAPEEVADNVAESASAAPALGVSPAGGEDPGPLGAGMPTPHLSVDGPVSATSYQGDGSMLTNLDPANLMSAVPVSQGGTGATDAAGARTALDVAQGPHVSDTNAGTECGTGQLLNGDGVCQAIPQDTNTNAETLCGQDRLLDGDGDCVENSGLSSLSPCSDGDVPTFSASSGWMCEPPLVIVYADMGTSSSGLRTVICPAGTLLVTGGLGGPDCGISLFEPPQAVATLELGSVAGIFFRCNLSLDPAYSIPDSCDCFAVCR